MSWSWNLCPARDGESVKFFEAFGLKEDPFGVTPDPRYLYLGPGHREALASLAHGIETNRGFMALIAPPGMGKTTLLFRLLECVRASAETVFHFQTQCNAQELLRFVLADLGVEPPQGDTVALHQQFNRELLRRNAAGRRVVVVVDEAQNLSNDVLEAIRLLSDFETPQRKLMQIVLSGQQQLLVRLASAKQEQLRQRISIVARLRPFGRQATASYIDHRLRIAGLKKEVPFASDALDLIAERTKGIPRNINNYCFQAMSVAFGLGRTQIDREVVEEVARDYELPMEMPPEEPDTLPSRVPEILSAVPTETGPVEGPSLGPVAATQVPGSSAPVSSEKDAFEALRAARQPGQREERQRVAIGKRVSKRSRPKHAIRRNAPFVIAMALAGMMAWWAWQLPQKSIAAPAEREPTQEPQVAPSAPPQGDIDPKTEAAPDRTRARRDSRPVVRLQGAARTSSGKGGAAMGDPVIPDSIPVADDANVVVLPQTARPAETATSDSSDVPLPNVPSSGSISDLSQPVAMPVLAPPLSKGATPPRLVRRRVPSYPPFARAHGVEGSVVLRVIVGKTGGVDEVSVVSGNPVLARAAMDAVREWRYEPATLNGQPTELETMVTLNFKR
jgi:TonB family protein